MNWVERIGEQKTDGRAFISDRPILGMTWITNEGKFKGFTKFKSKNQRRDFRQILLIHRFLSRRDDIFTNGY